MFSIFRWKVCVLVVFVYLSGLTGLRAQMRTPADLVNPFIGTAGTGHTFPGATVPFALVQLSPETGYAGWPYCSGYRYEDSTIMGFSHTHLSGTGAVDLGDLLLMPFTGSPEKDHFRSSFSHKEEVAAPGYYKVKLRDYNVQAQLTSTARAGFHQYRFAAKEGYVLVDLRHALMGDSGRLENHTISSGLEVVDATTLRGHTRTSGWAGDQHVYFYIRFEQPFVDYHWVSDSVKGKNQRIAFRFKGNKALQVQVKVGLSTVSIENAKLNLDTEIPGWDFNKVRDAAKNNWNEYLSAIAIKGRPDQQQIFYTALYHSLIAPNNIADVNGDYRGADNKVYQSKQHGYYSTFSLWDTYRALNSLFTMIAPDKVNAFIHTMVAHQEVAGFLPIWTLWGHENYCMIGNHSVPVIAEAYLKGIRDFDVEKAYRAMKTSLTVPHKNSDWEKYNRYGYLPADSIRVESVSTTLENTYDDWCMAQLAKALGKQEDYALFMKRAGYYRNVFDASTGLMRGRKSNGDWVTPFDAFKISHASTSGGDYTEANAWQYTWHVQHDVDGLIQLLGGRDAFIRKLDSLFSFDSKVVGDGATVDVTGLIGQYVQGNEPCHHVAYLYTLAGAPRKTQEKVRTITSTLYQNTPDGLSGNDDCGQMSAWYIFSAMGFYPVSPASGEYVIGAPQLDEAVIRLPGNKTFMIRARNHTPENRFVQQILLNGKPYHQPVITHATIMQGGVMEFVMGSQ